MHGIIFAELKKFADSALGPTAWPAIVAEAGVGHVSYLATQSYPDQQLVALVEGAVHHSGIPGPQLLEKFGTFIVPDLVQVFRAFLKPEWTALDLLEHTETVIHRAIRLRDPNARPPRLRITRPVPSQVVIEYSSQRRLCAVAKGIMRGVATHYNEPLVITETTCMHTGARVCTLVASRP